MKTTPQKSGWTEAVDEPGPRRARSRRVTPAPGVRPSGAVTARSIRVRAGEDTG